MYISYFFVRVHEQLLVGANVHRFKPSISICHANFGKMTNFSNFTLNLPLLLDFRADQTGLSQ